MSKGKDKSPDTADETTPTPPPTAASEKSASEIDPAYAHHIRFEGRVINTNNPRYAASLEKRGGEKVK